MAKSECIKLETKGALKDEIVIGLKSVESYAQSGMLIEELSLPPDFNDLSIFHL